MSEPFKVHRPGKMLDWIENHVTEWAEQLVLEHFGADTIGELTRDQIDEVVVESDEVSDFDSTLGLGFRNVISTWENENDEYIF
jgi:hypothetical protein